MVAEVASATLHSPVMLARIAATESTFGTTIIRSTSSRMKLGSTRGRPMPSMREPGAVSAASPLA